MKKQKGGGLLGLFKPSTTEFTKAESDINSLSQGRALTMGALPSSISTLMRSGRREARERQLIYEKWSEMQANPFVNTAIWLQTTAALGGHETTGDLVFIECKEEVKDKNMLALVDDITTNLTEFINSIAFKMIFTGASYGDAYARVYSEKKVGVLDVYTDELVSPQLIQPFERGSRTIGYALTTGKNSFERLSIAQMARLKMPRVSWVPQMGVYEKSLVGNLTNDDVSSHELMPSSAGGSFLHGAEESYDNLNASLAGLIGQRWLDSIDEQIVTLNMTDMNNEQQKKFTESVVAMLTRSKEVAEKSVKSGRPFLERMKHIIPVWSEKQVQQITPMNGGQSGRSGDISLDDVMFHAKNMVGALGTDLSMVGFADQLSGGLGDGGFFRMSAQTAERSRISRIALRDCIEQIINIHCFQKHGMVIPAGERPWKITFYSSISALAAEQARTRLDAANASLTILQAIDQMKAAGVSFESGVAFLRDEMQLDESAAKVYAEVLKTPEGGAPGGGMGGF